MSHCGMMTGLLLKFLRALCLLLSAAALAAIGALLISDIAHHLRFTSLHSRLGAIGLIMIGSSYAVLQFTSPGPSEGIAKRVLLGAGFVLWGAEQLLPGGWWTTAMDSAVITIFVLDLGLIVLNQLKPTGDLKVAEKSQQSKQG